MEYKETQQGNSNWTIVTDPEIETTELSLPWSKVRRQLSDISGGHTDTPLVLGYHMPASLSLTVM